MLRGRNDEEKTLFKLPLRAKFPDEIIDSQLLTVARLLV